MKIKMELPSGALNQLLHPFVVVLAKRRECGAGGGVNLAMPRESALELL